jgi:class 3 adenylate cyclase
MTGTPIHYQWKWKLRSSPEALWPLVSDTNRFNQDTGLPPIYHLPGAARFPARRLGFRMYGVQVEWDEEPFEWFHPHQFGVLRRYVRGPIHEVRVQVNLDACDGGTHLTYQVWVTPRNVFGSLVIPLQVGWLNARSFDRVMRRYDAAIQRGEIISESGARPHLAAGSIARIQDAQAALAASTAPRAIERLVGLLTTADDLTLSRLRPYFLADLWGMPRRAVLEMFLRATRAGLLNMYWELICPSCRGPARRVDTLAQIQSNIHCESCNIDFNVNFEHSVELTFRPNPAIRPLPNQLVFCVAGPQVSPHVALKQNLAPGEKRLLQPLLDPGRYRLRTVEQTGAQHLCVQANGLPALTVRLEQPWPEAELTIAPAPQITIENTTHRPITVLLERTAWSDLAATAADVITLQIFRDLFSREALRPGEQVSVGSLTLLFTDLRESTRLYRQIGDAPAFGRVMSHFDVLRTAIANEEGAIVKTMGDSVMAAFRHPAAALRAVLAAQRAIPEPLQIKAGIHHGPCIAVTLNERLDYFGTTVNLAARLVHLASGGDVIISEAVANDPEVAAWLRQQANALHVEAFEAPLKGFETPFVLRRLAWNQPIPQEALA